MAELYAIQMVSSESISDNFQQLEKQLDNLQFSQPSLVVIPECFSCFDSGKKQAYIALSGEHVAIQSRLCKLAKMHGIWLVTGTFPKPSIDENKFFATSMLINDRGEVVEEYHKIHLFDVDVADGTGSYRESTFTSYGQHLSVVDTPFGRIGMAVCYDVRFAGMFAAMGQIDILVVPSAFTYKTGEAHWQTLLTARAIEKQCYVIASNQGGTHGNGRQTYGHSCIISPWGKVLTMLEQGIGSVSSVIDNQLLSDIRRAMPVYQHSKFRSHFD